MGQLLPWNDNYCFIVSVPVKFEWQLENVSVCEKEEAEFECKTNSAESQLVWCVKNQIVRNSNKYKLQQDGSFHRMTIRDCQQQDAGTVEAITGDSRTTAQLQVEGK